MQPVGKLPSSRGEGIMGSPLSALLNEKKDVVGLYSASLFSSASRIEEDGLVCGFGEEEHSVARANASGSNNSSSNACSLFVGSSATSQPPPAPSNDDSSLSS